MGTAMSRGSRRPTSKSAAADATSAARPAMQAAAWLANGRIVQHFREVVARLPFAPMHDPREVPARGIPRHRPRTVAECGAHAQLRAALRQVLLDEVCVRFAIGIREERGTRV